MRGNAFLESFLDHVDHNESKLIFNDVVVVNEFFDVFIEFLGLPLV